MSLWHDNPEWFDEWIEKQALDGRFGPEIKRHVEQGEMLGSDLWDMSLGTPELADLGREAEQSYCERLIE